MSASGVGFLVGCVFALICFTEIFKDIACILLSPVYLLFKLVCKLFSVCKKERPASTVEQNAVNRQIMLKCMEKKPSANYRLFDYRTFLSSSRTMQEKESDARWKEMQKWNAMSQEDKDAIRKQQLQEREDIEFQQRQEDRHREEAERYYENMQRARMTSFYPDEEPQPVKVQDNPKTDVKIPLPPSYAVKSTGGGNYNVYDANTKRHLYALTEPQSVGYNLSGTNIVFTMKDGSAKIVNLAQGARNHTL